MEEQPNLADEAFDDDLEEQLKELGPHPAATRLTLSLAGVVLVVGGFLGGILVQKNFGTATTGSSNSASSNRSGGGNFAGGAMPSGVSGSGGRQGGMGASGRAGGQSTGGSSSATTGKIKMVDGTTVYVETSDGTVIIVKTTSGTTIQTTQSSSVSDLSVGSQVTVEGTNNNGTIDATKVTKSK